MLLSLVVLVMCLINPFVILASTPEPASTVDWFADYTIITESELQSVLKGNSVQTAVRNMTSGNLYLTLEDGEGYKLEKSSPTLNAFLRSQGVELEAYSFTEPDTKDEKKDSAYDADRLTGLMIACSIIAVVIAYFILHRQKVPAVSSLAGDDIKTSREDVPKVRFSDVEGIEELKQDVVRLVDCLKSPDKYMRIGARPPKGVILYGPPGTGKTLIAKAIAGEAGVPFISAVGSDFVEKYVGVGAARVRDLYKKARKSAPCIVFIDEIDAVAGQRGSSENSERDQTINALLSELDGFKVTDNIITICATNRLDMLDSAFKRAGRFDLKLAVGLPDKTSRINILKIHSRDKLLSDDVDLKAIANKTVGFSGAELEALLNEAALIAVTHNNLSITPTDVNDAFFKIVTQGNKKRREKITEVNRIVAWHEIGHTLASKLLTDDTVSSVTIVGSASGAGGVTFRAPNEDNQLQSKKYLESSIMVMYAGRAAEELYYGNSDDITVGARQDIVQATSLIKDYLGIYGMGSKGMLDISQFSRDSLSILDESTVLSNKLYTQVLSLLETNRGIMEVMVEALIDKETLEEDEINDLVAKGA